MGSRRSEHYTAPLNPRGELRHGVGDRSSNSQAAEESRETITARSVLPRTGPIQNQHAAHRSADAVGSLSSPHKPWLAAKRDFPRRGCRMGGCPCYSRGGGMVQGGNWFLSETGFWRKLVSNETVDFFPAGKRHGCVRVRFREGSGILLWIVSAMKYLPRRLIPRSGSNISRQFSTEPCTPLISSASVS